MRYLQRPHRGVILLLVLIVVTMLALGSLGFAELMLNEHRAAKTSSRQSQARVFAESGAELARQFLDRTTDEQKTAGGLYDNAQRFSSQLVADDNSPRDRGRFTLIAPRFENNSVTGVRYGLQDESARINLAMILSDTSSVSGGNPGGATNNSKKILMGLPGMTDAIADAILDWIDADDTPREQGAESEYYGSLQPGYAPRNAPPASIEELLLVRGVTPELLFGLDAAKMGYSSSNPAGGTIASIDNSDGSMDHGWAAYLTLWSAESNLKADGTPKIYLNQKDLKKLYDALVQVLDEPSATFIVAYRQNYQHESGHTTEAGSGKNDFNVAAKQDVKSILDLIDRSQDVHFEGQDKNKYTNLKPPFMSDTAAMSNYLPKLFANCTTDSGKSTPGRININQAPRTVLLCIPGMTSDLADQIISNRVPDPASPSAKADQTCPAWPLIEGIMPKSTMQSMLKFITAGGSVYRAQIIGHFDKGNPVARLQVLLDATQRPTRVLLWKDMSRMTGGFPGEINGAIGEH